MLLLKTHHKFEEVETLTVQHMEPTLASTHHTTPQTSTFRTLAPFALTRQEPTSIILKTKHRANAICERTNNITSASL